MAYGAFNTGSGASTYDLDLLAAGVINGCVNAPLTTTDEVVIATRNGKQIVAYTVRPQKKSDDDLAVTNVVAGLVRMVEAFRSEALVERRTLAADIIRGIISAPLMTADENLICLSGGEPLLAYQVDEDEKSYTDKTVKKAIAELFATVEWYLARIDADEKSYTDRAIAELSVIVEQYQAQNVATMQTLETERQILAADIMRGTVSAPLLTKSGMQIFLANGEQLFAYQVREDEKSYADMAIMKNFAELSATVERYQAQNLAVMQSLITGLMSGQLAVPMANNEGTVVITPSGVNITAVKNL